MAPDSRPRRQHPDSFPAVADYLTRADDLDCIRIVEKGLGAICKGEWEQACALWVEDATDPDAVIMLLERGLVIRWHELVEYPDYFWVTYMGPLDEFPSH